MSVDLRLGDCLEILPTLADKSVDAIITDVPYGTTACKWDVIILCKGAFVTTASQPFTSVLIMSNLDWFKYEWIWRKTKAGNFINANNAPLKLHENVIVFSPKTIANHSQNRMTYNPLGVREVNREWRRPQKYSSDHNYARPSHGLQRVIKREGFPSSVIDIGSEHNPPHPTQKPVALYEYLIKTYTNEGDTVLDFCMGSGTTGVACVKTGRNFIGIEKELPYFEIAQRRIKEAQQQMTMELPV